MAVTRRGKALEEIVNGPKFQEWSRSSRLPRRNVRLAKKGGVGPVAHGM